jgi:hypothetical protein
MINLSKEIINEEMNNFFINNKDNFKFNVAYELDEIIELIIDNKKYSYIGGYYINKNKKFLILKNSNIENFYKLDEKHIGIKYSKLIDIDFNKIKINTLFC